MKIRELRILMRGMNDEAEVLVSINGTAFELQNGLGCEMHDNDRIPYVVVELGRGYRFGARP